MRVCYIVLTCEKYVTTRREWQLATMFKHFPKEDIYYLGHMMDVDRRIFSWGAGDEYDKLPYKFLYFFKNMLLDYDWYVFIDDDTFVFHDRLVSFLNDKDSLERICIGKQLDHIKDSPWGLYMSGGAGTVLSRGLYRKLCEFIQVIPNPAGLVFHWCADICLGLWMRLISDVQKIDHPGFHTDMHLVSNGSLEHAVTFHHLKQWDDFLFYDLIYREKIENR